MGVSDIGENHVLINLRGELRRVNEVVGTVDSLSEVSSSVEESVVKGDEICGCICIGGVREQSGVDLARVEVRREGLGQISRVVGVRGDIDWRGGGELSGGYQWVGRGVEEKLNEGEAKTSQYEENGNHEFNEESGDVAFVDYDSLLHLSVEMATEASAGSSFLLLSNRVLFDSLVHINGVVLFSFERVVECVLLHSGPSSHFISVISSSYCKKYFFKSGDGDSILRHS